MPLSDCILLNALSEAMRVRIICCFGEEVIKESIKVIFFLLWNPENHIVTCDHQLLGVIWDTHSCEK